MRCWGLNTAIAWPNPTPGRVVVELEGFRSQKIRLQVLSLTGQVLQEQQFLHDGAGTQKELNLEAYPKGLYIIRLQGEDGVWVREVVVE